MIQQTVWLWKLHLAAAAAAAAADDDDAVNVSRCEYSASRQVAVHSRAPTSAVCQSRLVSASAAAACSTADTLPPGGLTCLVTSRSNCDDDDVDSAVVEWGRRATPWDRPPTQQVRLLAEETLSPPTSPSLYTHKQACTYRSNQPESK